MNCPKCGAELRVGVLTFRLKGWLRWDLWPFGNLLYETTAFFRGNGAAAETEIFFYTGLPIPAEYCKECGTTVIVKEEAFGVRM